MMLTNYIKTAVRNLIRYKIYSFANILGLSTGMFACLFIYAWILSETSFDSFHERSDQIYRVTYELTLGDTFREAASSMSPLVPSAIERFASVSAGTTIRPDGQVWLTHETKRVNLPELIYADESFFDLFSFELIYGVPQEVLQHAYTAVITQESAIKLFGENNPLGEIVRINTEFDCTITGVVENCPSNSHFQFDIIVSFETMRAESPDVMAQWGRMGNYSYLLLQPGTDTKALESELTSVVNEHLGAALKSRGGGIEMRLQPITDIHLHSNLNSEIADNGSIESVNLFAAIGIIILIMAGLNFMSITTARSSSRMLEVYVRRTFGASKTQLFSQFLIESSIIILISIAFSVIASILLLPAFQGWVGRELEFTTYSTPVWVLASAFFGFVSFLLIGIVPAFHLSTLSSTRNSNGSLSRIRGSAFFRRTLVLLQFSISTTLIIAALATNNQIAFMKERDLGMANEGLILFPNMAGVPPRTMSTLRNEIADIVGVNQVSLTSATPLLGPFPSTTYQQEGDIGNRSQLMKTIACDEHFLSSLGLTVVEGRNFAKDRITDSTSSVLINETVARLFGWNNPVGKKLFSSIRTSDGVVEIQKTVIGVVKDFHFESLHRKIEPLVISREATIQLHHLDRMVAKINTNDYSAVLPAIESTWRKIAPSLPFDYTIFEDLLRSTYKKETRMMQLVRLFGFLAVVVAMLGLLGMTANSSERRMREIGIRKTFGATTQSIVVLLMKESVILALLSAILSGPIAYHFTNQWLAGFAYRSTIEWDIFVIAGSVSLVTAILTTIYHSLRAGLANPVDSIRYE